jgi:hypothetical protein
MDLAMSIPYRYSEFKLRIPLLQFMHGFLGGRDIRVNLIALDAERLPASVWCLVRDGDPHVPLSFFSPCSNQRYVSQGRSSSLHATGSSPGSCLGRGDRAML